jgi:hypothetical protein
MQFWIVIGLIALAFFLYFAKRFIPDKKLERLANAFSVAALIAAVLVFIVPTVVPEESQQQQSITPLVLAFFDEYTSIPTGIILSQIPQQVDDVQVRNADVISQPSGNWVSIIITNEGGASRVNLRNYIPIRIMSYTTIPDTYNVFLRGGGGGGFYIRNFVAKLSSNSPSLIIAEYLPEGHQTIDEIRDQPGFEYWQKRLPSPMKPDYFYLDPGESEVFVVELMYLAPGHYVFQLGVDYFYSGKWQTQWLEQSIDALLPQSFEWYDEESGLTGRLIHTGQCSFVLPQNSQDTPHYNCVSEN